MREILKMRTVRMVDSAMETKIEIVLRKDLAQIANATCAPSHLSDDKCEGHAAVLTDNGRTGMPPFQEVQLSLSGPNAQSLHHSSRHTVFQTSRPRTNACPIFERTASIYHSFAN